ncbi:excinuclease ABC subunit C [Anaerosporomusa subterranea]|uniref:Excinuclease ABC subunit C n=1 Tax=Anaerosporomusa subterranea TaxID=1794912 RepID=A0A154BWU3_ANASB|nr:GIY-YIG nuclease family protein [Anaerosporomusa subterranea]KYZ77948.1 excinuclease ABC subunit C [Anaerosporomusa subterranea]
MDRRKELILAYKQTPTPMGVYQVKNCTNGKVFIGSSMNLPGRFNRLRFQLKANANPIRSLQAEWNDQGADVFTFEVLETLNPDKVPKDDWRKALAVMEDKWLNEIKPYGLRGYNKEKAD